MLTGTKFLGTNARRWVVALLFALCGLARSQEHPVTVVLTGLNGIPTTDIQVVLTNPTGKRYIGVNAVGTTSFVFDNLPESTYMVFATVPGILDQDLGDVQIAATTSQVNLTVTHDTASDLRPDLIIDSAALDEPSRASVVDLLARVQSPDALHTYTVQEGDSLYGIIHKLYGYYDSGYKMTADNLATAVREINDLPSNKIVAGKTLSVPALPKRPTGDATTRTIQHANVMTGEVESSIASMDRRPASAPASLDLEKSKLWQVHGLSDDQIRELKAAARLKNGKGAATEYFGTKEISVTLLSSNACNCEPPLPPATMNNVSVMPAPPLIIIDSFHKKISGNCSHGDMVYLVAARVLNASNGSNLASAIERRELDFYADKTAAGELIRKYAAATLTHDYESQVLSDLKKLQARTPISRNKSVTVPLLYLQALLEDAKNRASVVSTSFWTYTNGFKWIPDDYGSESNPVFVGAVLNNQNSLAENSIYARTEPLQSYLRLRNTHGVLLVGGEQPAGKPFGMVSRQAAVSCVGQAGGWSGLGSCFEGDAGVGNSFAAPQIAAMVFLARNRWEARNVHVGAAETRTRFLLASEVNPTYVGVYASAGLPVLVRLVESGSYAIKRDDSIVSAVLDDSSEVQFVDSDNKSYKAAIRRGKNGDVSGLQIQGDNVFIFRESTMHWEQVTLQSLHVAFKGGQTLNGINEFNSTYKGVVAQ